MQESHSAFRQKLIFAGRKVPFSSNNAEESLHINWYRDIASRAALVIGAFALIGELRKYALAQRLEVQCIVTRVAAPGNDILLHYPR